MGQAKARGTFEQRLASAKPKKPRMSKRELEAFILRKIMATSPLRGFIEAVAPRGARRG
jgi:hypothetical protein